MKHTKATIRYAKAFFQLSLEKDLLENSYQDMLLIQKACHENKDLVLLLRTPIVKTEHKTRIINKIFAEKVNKLTLKFINIIIDKKREEILMSLAKQFILFYKEHKNIALASVITAHKLTEEARKEVLKLVKKHKKKEVELKEIVDKKIIGGVVIKMDNKQLDASVSSEILALRKRFNKNI
tara:strand:+ start:247 stop:789 length:543 start_codon:yes stop_codon:yes gene_type:complete